MSIEIGRRGAILTIVVAIGFLFVLFIVSKIEAVAELEYYAVGETMEIGPGQGWMDHTIYSANYNDTDSPMLIAAHWNGGSFKCASVCPPGYQYHFGDSINVPMNAGDLLAFDVLHDNLSDGRRTRISLGGTVVHICEEGWVTSCQYVASQTGTYVVAFEDSVAILQELRAATPTPTTSPTNTYVPPTPTTVLPTATFTPTQTNTPSPTDVLPSFTPTETSEATATATAEWTATSTLGATSTNEATSTGQPTWPPVTYIPPTHVTDLYCEVEVGLQYRQRFFQVWNTDGESSNEIAGGGFVNDSGYAPIRVWPTTGRSPLYRITIDNLEVRRFMLQTIVDETGEHLICVPLGQVTTPTPVPTATQPQIQNPPRETVAPTMTPSPTATFTPTPSPTFTPTATPEVQEPRAGYADANSSNGGRLVGSIEINGIVLPLYEGFIENGTAQLPAMGAAVFGHTVYLHRLQPPNWIRLEGDVNMIIDGTIYQFTVGETVNDVYGTIDFGGAWRISTCFGDESGWLGIASAPLISN